VIEKLLNGVAQGDLDLAAKSEVVGIRLVLQDVLETTDSLVEVSAKRLQTLHQNLELADVVRVEALHGLDRDDPSFIECPGEEL
jgi:hypothetical protein